MGTSDQLSRNALLAAFPPEAFAQISPHLELVEFPLGRVLFDKGVRQDYVYFPVSAVVSLLHETHRGVFPEIAVVGREGVVGVSFALGGERTFERAAVKVSGTAVRVGAAHLREQFGLGGPVMYLLLRYTRALLKQISMTAECQKQHSADQRLCRWLLLTLDRLNTSELTMSRELITKLLGSPTVIVSRALHLLQRRGLIEASGNGIRVLNRHALELHSCNCYAAVKAEYDQALPPSLDIFEQRH